MIDVTRVDVVGPHLTHRELGVPLPQLLAPVDTLCDLVRNLPRVDWDQGKCRSRPVPDPAQLVAQIFSVGPLFPKVLDRARIQVGFPIPIADLGGVERVVHNLGGEARRRGWVPHLFVIGSGRTRMLSEFRDTFETITLLGDPDMITDEHLVGLLGSMDVVINNHCSAVYAISRRLQRLGVKVFAQLHVVDVSHHGVPGGLPYLTLDYEHGLDGVLVVSKRLRDWCRAWGVPEEKLFLVPNAPSFEVSESVLTTTMVDRARRSSRQKLRALFIGRFDRQKGLDRLAALVARSNGSGFVDWRIVGKCVLNDDWAHQSFAPLKRVMRPPAVSSRELTALYRWADVLVMTSRFEGSPLTILEAQRLGCVVLSTNVGAISELIESGHHGILFDNELPEATLVDQMLRSLEGLHHNRARLLAMSRAAATAGRERTWTRAFSQFGDAVERELRIRQGAMLRKSPEAAEFAQT